MKFTNSIAISALALLQQFQSASALIWNREQVEAKEAKNIQPIKPKFLELKFDRHYGESYEDSTLGKDGAVHLEKRTFDSAYNGSYEDVILTNQLTFYSVELDIGTPAQKVTVVVDTGSSDLWITETSNPFCSTGDDDTEDSVWSPFLLKDKIDPRVLKHKGKRTTSIDVTATATTGSINISIDLGSNFTLPPEFLINCTEFGTFNTKKSSTFKNNHTDFFISYGDNTFASGYWGRDVLSFQDINVTGLSFGVANVTNSTVGVLGIGLPELESTYFGTVNSVNESSYIYNNFPQVLKNSGIINKTAYSLFLNKSDSTQGSLLLGAVDTSKFADKLYTVPMLNINPSKGYTDPSAFLVLMQKMTRYKYGQGHLVPSSRIPVLLDSGTTMVYLPRSIVEQIMRHEEAQYVEELDLYQIKCPSPNKKNQTSFSFDFGGFQIKASLSDFIVPTDNGQCIFGMIPQDMNVGILGDSFLTHAYVVYDLEDYEISMAQAVYDGGEPNYIPIVSTVPSAVRAKYYSATDLPSGFAIDSYNNTSKRPKDKTTFSVQADLRNTISGDITTTIEEDSAKTETKHSNAGVATVPTYSSIIFTFLLSILI